MHDHSGTIQKLARNTGVALEKSIAAKNGNGALVIPKHGVKLNQGVEINKVRYIVEKIRKNVATLVLYKGHDVHGIRHGQDVVIDMVRYRLVKLMKRKVKIELIAVRRKPGV